MRRKAAWRHSEAVTVNFTFCLEVRKEAGILCRFGSGFQFLFCRSLHSELDAVPTEPAQHAWLGRHQPDHADSSSSRPSRIRAPHATSFDIYQKLQADLDFTKIAEDIIIRTYDTGKLDQGATFQFKVVGRNSLGDGPESAVATITVT